MESTFPTVIVFYSLVSSTVVLYEPSFLRQRRKTAVDSIYLFAVQSTCLVWNFAPLWRQLLARVQSMESDFVFLSEVQLFYAESIVDS